MKLSDQTIKKIMPFLSGTVVCLFAIVMVFNIGVPARVLTFLFTYLFGIGAYVIYGVAYFIGFTYLIKGHGLKFKKRYQYFACILLFVGALIITTAIVHKDTEIEYLNKYPQFFESLNYFNEHTINLFKQKVAGGQIGWAFTALFNNISIGVTYVIAILFILAGLIIFFKEPIFAYIKGKRGSSTPKEKKQATSAPKEKKERKPMFSFLKKNKPEKVETYDVMEQARSVNKVEPVREDRETVSFTSTNAFTAPSKPAVNPYFNTGINPFVKAYYQKPGIPIKQPVSPTPSGEPLMEYKKAELAAPMMQPEEALLKANEEQTRAEQLQLDFNAKPELDEKLVMSKPEFVPPQIKEEPRVVPNEVAVEQPKPRKPIKWVAPSSDLLDTMENSETEELNKMTADQRTAAINEVFENFHIGAEVVSTTIGPSVTRYNIKYQANVSSRAVNNIVEDISIRLGGIPARFEAVVEGSYYSGLEVPNAKASSVSFKEIYESLPDVKKHPLAVGFGKNISGDVITADFNEFPHILVAGTTGSGKSVFIHSLITTLIMRNSPENLRLILIDPKQVEMVRYRDMPHLLCPIITESKKAAVLMKKLTEEMNDRYHKFADADGATSLDEYNDFASEHGLDKLPYIVVIVDEFGDLVKTNKEVAEPILILGQKARACGIHMLLSTQSPTSDIVTGPIKSNLPTHVALCTANSTQSVTILGEGGAEKLLGRGDMLVQSPLVSRVGLVRAQGCYIQKKETSRVIGYLKEHYETIYDEKYLNLEEQSEIEGQALAMSGAVAASSDAAEERRYQEIKSWVMSNQYMSMSRIQGECAVGFNRARRFFTRLQQEGVVGLETEGNKGCRVLIHDDFGAETIVTSDELTY